MKLNHLAYVLTTCSFLIVPVSTYGHQIFSTSYPVLMAQELTSNNLSGHFISAEKPTTGSVKIITENGHHYLEFDESFSASNEGPDLHVLLDTVAKPPQSYQNLGRLINLGKLKSFTGFQRYSIPDVINITQYKSVVIWCRMANATFGYAPISVSK